jgi:hypothetical protein
MRGIRNMNKSNSLRAQILALLLVFSFAMSISLACAGKNEGPQPPAGEIKPVEAQPVEGQEPPVEGTPAIPAPKHTAEEALEQWPDDVPLMEPYTVESYLGVGDEHKQLTITVPYSLGDVFEFYVGSLETNGWEPTGEPMGNLVQFFSFRCTKDNRELSLMAKPESGEGESLIIFRLKE